jgi:metallo-beta-lactamase family protein
VFVGFAARGTLARRIIDGASSVRIFGDDIQIRAQIHTINGFSAHADQAELLAWHESTGKPERTFLVHGDEDVMQNFSQLLHDTQVEMPLPGQSYTL